MLKKSTKSIFEFGVRQKVVLVLMCVLLTALSVSSWFALQEEKANILKEIEQRGSDISRFVAKSLVYSVIGYDYHTIDLLLQEITLSKDIGYSKVVNSKGNTMAEAGTLLENDPLKMVIFTNNLMLNDEVVGTLTLGLSTESTMKRLEQQKYSLIKREAIIILLIAIGEVIALSFIIIKPVSIISKSLNEKKAGSHVLGTIPLYSKDEFGQLAKQFNELSQNLNLANAELQSRIEYADKELIETNNILLERSGELMELNLKFKKLSETDSLTGLYNRRYFEDKLAEEIASVKRYDDIFSLLVMDIDKFKSVNDNFGHTHGDIVIKMVAETMKERFRETDVLCRIGGEEFVAVCKRASKQTAIELAEDIRAILENKIIKIGEDEINVTISIGIATADANNIHDSDFSVFKCADIALFYSKEHGRNCINHFDEIKVKAV